MKQSRLLSSEGISPLNYSCNRRIKYQLYDVRVDRHGDEAYEASGIEFQEFQQPGNRDIVWNQYFRSPHAGGLREISIQHLVTRVSEYYYHGAIMLMTQADAAIFRDELQAVFINMLASPGSPVWYNAGLTPEGVKPQCSSCFIQSVQDDLDSIMDLARNEVMLFRNGSGTGTNFSGLRAASEPLTRGGEASGPISFMKGLDAFAGVIRSGGACLAPHQRVYTVDLGPVAVKHLADTCQDFQVLSYDPPANRYKVKTARAWRSGFKKVVRITTDKGIFDLSEDHPVRLSTGHYAPAGTLEAGWSLFACSVWDNKGYLEVSLRTGKREHTALHRLVAQDVLGVSRNDKLVIDHLDGDRYNNHPSNLALKTQSEHARRHNNEAVADGIHVFQKVKFSHRGPLNGMHREGSFWKDPDRVMQYRQIQREHILKDSNRARKQQDTATRVRVLKGAFRILNNGYSIDTFEDYLQGRRALGIAIDSKAKVLKRLEKRFGSYEQFRQEVAASNHRVLSVKILGSMDVYDVEVDCPSEDDKSPNSGHNFVIWQGDSKTGSGIAISNTRRAARMCILNIDHPDIEAFIHIKEQANKDAFALVAGGAREKTKWSDPKGPQQNVFYQNANNSVRLTDAFMEAVEADEAWHTNWVVTGEVAKTYRARDLMRQIAEASWACGDPGVQFDDTINRWHTCPKNGRINASNPCSEHLFLDESSCNLASIDLKRFMIPEGTVGKSPGMLFDVDKYVHVIRLLITAMDITVGEASYPTPEIERNSLLFRPLGLGFCDLGSLLMRLGIPYDSDEGRLLGGILASILGAASYLQSAVLAESLGPFHYYSLNKDDVLRVIRAHANMSEVLTESSQYSRWEWMAKYAEDVWRQALEMAEKHGVRNAQVTLMAPTGTIRNWMCADTTGIEPESGLVVYKSLAHGGTIKYTCPMVEDALKSLGYLEEQIAPILKYVQENSRIEGAPGLDSKHYLVFDTAFVNPGGTRYISVNGHIDMMAMIQPFLSGAISKTVNYPNNATVDDFLAGYHRAWKAGLKSLAFYRDGCLLDSPLSTVDKSITVSVEPVETLTTPARRRLPDERAAITHKFSVSNYEGYLTVGLYEDGKPGELFIVMNKQGSIISGLMDAFATAISMNLQYGVPLNVLVKKFQHTRFEPSGFTNNKDLPIASSVIDYIFRWLEKKFVSQQSMVEALMVVGTYLNGYPVITNIVDTIGPQAQEKQCPECPYYGPMPGCACPNCGSVVGGCS